MSETHMRFVVDVHLDVDDPELNDISVPRDERVQNNIYNIAATIDENVVNEYGVPYVTVSTRHILEEDDVSALKFSRELDELVQDAVKLGAGPHRTAKTANAFMALYEHSLQGDLFEHTEVPTPSALLQIFSFLTIP